MKLIRSKYPEWIIAAPLSFFTGINPTEAIMNNCPIDIDGEDVDEVIG